MSVECTGAHHKGCACHEAARDAEIASLRAKLDRVRDACLPAPHWQDCMVAKHGEHAICDCSADGRNLAYDEIAALLGEP